jgi:hypothetical protein
LFSNSLANIYVLGDDDALLAAICLKDAECINVTLSLANSSKMPQRRRKKKSVIDPDFGSNSFPSLPPKTTSSANSPWGPPLGPPISSFLKPQTLLLMPQHEQDRYKLAFAANRADRKTYREALKLEKYEKLRKENQLRRALGSRKRALAESQFAGSDKVFDNTVSVLASSALAMAAKLAYNVRACFYFSNTLI